MFGTLRLTPNSKSVDFIEKADGRSFSEMGNTVPPHSACTHCRSKKLRCGGQKPACVRCKATSVKCVYAPVDGSFGRRRGLSGQKRSHDGYVVRDSASTAAPATTDAKQTVSCSDASITVAQGRRSPSASASSSSASASSLSISKANSPSPSTAPTSRPPSTASQDSLIPISISSAPHADITKPSNRELTPDSTACLDPDLLNDALGQALSSHSMDAEFHFLDTETSIGTVEKSTHVGGDGDIFHDPLIADFNASLAAFWSIPASYTDTHGFPTPPRADSFSSLMTTVNIPAPIPITSGTHLDKCARQCLSTVTPLLEEVENLTHSMMPDRLEAVLAWHKRACEKCLQVLRCQRCYSSSELMMLIVMLCDKLIMLTKKLLWHTLDEAHFGDPIRIREYETADPGEIIAIFRLLSSHRVKDIGKLLASIKASPAVEGKQVQLIMIRNMEQQVTRTLEGIKECLTGFVV
ncbi:hypothetical protein F4802DRAFT_595407 [Xylaria palmicola]|nr:hypothetical protein F4802DRAFT_595407 [Xylaria palmicola]